MRNDKVNVAKGADAMSSMTNIWIHTFFGTRDLVPVILPEFEEFLYAHIRMKIEDEYVSKVRNINGIANHIHVLFQLNPNFPLASILKNVKGESSYWVNENNFIETKFLWQKSYDAYSVSPSDLEKVDAFISNQKAFHRKITFLEEQEMIRRKFGNQPSKPF